MTTSNGSEATARWLSIRRPSRDLQDLYRVAAFDDRADLRIARSAEGFALLIEETTTPRAPIVLRNLTVRFNATCQVEENGTAREGCFTIVVCTSPERQVQLTFVQAATALVDWRTADGASLSSVVEALVELFRAAARPPQSSIIGVWGELFVITRAADVGTALESWRSTARDRHDFARGTDRIEVKTTIGARRHHFSLDQVTPAEHESVWVISILTGTSAAGATVLDLVHELVARAGSSTASDQVMIKVSQALGSDVVRWAEDRFDTALAADSRRLFEVASVPRPIVDDQRVREVRFVADLSEVDAIDVVSSHALAASVAPTSRRPTQSN